MRICLIGLAFVWLGGGSLSLGGGASVGGRSLCSFEIGRISVSEYLLKRQVAKLSSSREIQEIGFDAWLQDWGDRLRVVNRAIDEGYVDHPQVTNAVDKMSMYMLTNGIDSPFARLVLDPMEDISERVGLLDDEEGKPSLQVVRERKRTRLAKAFLEESSIAMEREGIEFVTDLFQRLDGSIDVPLELIERVRDLHLYSYFSSGHEVSVGVREYLEEYVERMVKLRPISEEMLRMDIGRALVSSYFYRISLERGAGEDWRFLEEKENFRNNVIYNTYIEFNFDAKSLVAEEAVVRYYEENLSTFEVPTRIEVWEVSVYGKESLARLRKTIGAVVCSVREDDDLGGSLGLMKGEGGANLFSRCIVEFGDGRYGESVERSLMETRAGELLPPVKAGDSYLLLVRGATKESRIRSLEEVREFIAEGIRKKKSEIVIEQVLWVLRKRFPLIVEEGCSG